MRLRNRARSRKNSTMKSSGIGWIVWRGRPHDGGHDCRARHAPAERRARARRSRSEHCLVGVAENHRPAGPAADEDADDRGGLERNAA